jgi:hypothetical protein
MARWLEIDQTTSDKIRQMHAWWLVKRGQRPLPDRLDVDPAELKALLPYILICDCGLDPFRVRYRLIGTRVVEVSGFNFVGRYLDELTPPDGDEPWAEHYRVAYDSRMPVYGATTVPTMHGDLFRYEFSIFPLTNGGSQVEQFLALEDYGETAPRVQQMIEDLASWKDEPSGA